ncbi:MAG TPA: DUF6599 family protein [Armatimonadota bacterium]|nr:DUF6599 family protein [Armatimonadota bacterium]
MKFTSSVTAALIGLYVTGVFGQTLRLTDTAVAGVQRLLARTGNLKGWRRRGPPRLFTGDRVFDYMDGAGEIPKACGYRALGVEQFAAPGGAVVTAEVYDMGTPANAFGLVSMKRDPKARHIELDHRAEAGTGELVLWKGRFTFILYSDKLRGIKAEQLLPLARSMTSAIRERGALPDLLQYLPHAGYVQNSVKYFHTKPALDTIRFTEDGSFQLTPSTEAAAASYAGGVSLVVIRYPTAGAAGAALRALPPAPRRRPLFVVGHDRLIGAAWDRTDGRAARKMLDKLHSLLLKPGSPWPDA